MKKFIKKTIAGLIAGVMAISSMPFATLTAQAADSPEKTYVKSNIESFTAYTGGGKYTYNGTDLSKSDSAYNSNVLYDDGGFNDSTTQGNNDNMHGKLYINNNTVLMYDGKNDTILPVVVRAWPTSKTFGAKIYFSGISIDDATTASSWEFKENWLGGKQTYNEWPTGTASYPSSNVSYGSGLGVDTNVSYIFKNKLYYKGTTSTNNYYEKFNNSIKFKVKNYYSSFGTKGLDVDVVSSTSNVYVINYKPIAEKIDAMKAVYAEIKANGEENYAEADLNAFYQAAYKVMTLNPNKFTYSSGVEKAVKDAGDAIKDVVDHYLTTATTKLTKVVKLDTGAYDNALAEAKAKVNETDKYTAESIAELQKVITEVESQREKVASQEELNALTAKILTAISNLVQTKFTVKFVKIKDGNPVEEPETTVNYGDPFQANAGANVKGWIVYTNGDKTKTRLNTLNQEVSVVITEDTKIEAYLSGEEATETSSKATFYGRHNQVVAIKYVAENQPLDTSDVEVPKVPFYDFVKWDVSKTDDGKEYIVKAVYKCTQAENDKCIVHFNGTDKAYTYNSYVYLFDANKNTKYALYSDEACTEADLLVVLDGVDFYTPQRKHIYVKEYTGAVKANVAVMGSFATKKDGENTAVYNCKFSLPADAKAVSWGVAIKFDDGSVKKFSIKEKSKRNEYSANVKAPATIKKVTAAAYVTYKQGETEETKMSDFVTVDLSTL
ncbi:hypothetical protein [uncultured Eubacterium sp.]|uniref:hypothetical protein n=1 Tax=uncultured Eubacterium sp. TaxID=165185 RepID=UPI0025DF7561|nr:hypothetical protein [uncultured Eubacterium sp.]